MHALQVLPLVALALSLLAASVPVLRAHRVRARIVWSVGLGYGGLVALVTWQALRGQSVVAPDAGTLVAGTVLGLTVVAGIAGAVRSARTQASSAAQASSVAESHSR
ncbi:hypothetical protein [Georgenia deserti]|uniref:Uncharacterized protein n=1 Tax=Georgenia deserti TaxID=2093781 RepID=A0ABW4L5V0_9MICO